MKKDQLKIGIILSYINLFAQNIIAIFYTPIMLRILGNNEYGLYQLVFSVIGYLNLLNFGFNSAYVRFYSRYKKNKELNNIYSLNGVFLTVFILISIITLILGIIIMQNIQNIFTRTFTQEDIKIAKILMIFMTFNLSITFISSVFDSYVIVHECYFFQRIIILLQTILNPIVAIPLLLLGYGSIGMVIATTILTLLKFSLNIYYCIKKLNMKFIFRLHNISLLREISAFSFYIFLNLIVDQINWNVDKFILGYISGTFAVAVYSIGNQINSIYISLSSSISSVYIPKVNKIVAEEKESSSILSDLFIKVGRVQFILLALVLFGYLVLGKFFIKVWAGEDYKVSYYVGLILMIPVTIPLIQNLGIEIQRAKNLHKFRSILYCLIALINILISIPLSKLFGPIGSALGTSLTMLIGNGLIMNIYYFKIIGLNIRKFWKNILSLTPPFIISFIICHILSSIMIVDNMLKFLVVGIIYVILTSVFLFKLSLEENEKKLVFSFIAKMGRVINYDRNKR